MATSYTSRSTRFTLLALLVLGSFVTACKNSGSTDPEIDPRDQIVGTYSGGFSVVISVGTLEGNPETGTSVTTITKASNAKQIGIENNYANGGLIEKVTAELQSDGSYLVIDKNTDQINNVLGKQITAEYTATAVFDVSKAALAYTATSRAVQTGTEVKKVNLLTATKK